MESIILLIIIILVIRKVKSNNNSKSNNASKRSYLLTNFTNVQPIDRAALKGAAGEWKINDILSSLPEKDYFIMNDIMIKDGDTTTQIDHVVASIYGIFVIETKNYSGAVYGNEYIDDWTECIHGKKYKFHNPIKQNYAHISALKNRFPHLDNSKFFSIIVFPDKVQLKVTTSNFAVIHYSELINEILSHKEQVNRYNDMYMMRYILNDENMESYQNKLDHIEQIHEKKFNKEIEKTISHNAEGKAICSKCGSELEYHPKGRYGPYYKCNNCNTNINEKKLQK